LEVSNEAEIMAAKAEATDATPLINDNDSSPPAMEMFLNAFLDLHNGNIVQHTR
jgi:hypothetical protein